MGLPPYVPPSRWSYLDLVAGVILSPRSFFRQAGDSLPLTRSLVLFVGVHFLLLLTTVLSIREKIPFFLVFSWPVGLFVLAGIIFQLLKLFLLSGLWQITAELCGGSGRARDALAVGALASLPLTFLILGQVLMVLLPLPYPLFLFLLATVAIAITSWGAVVAVVGICHTHNLSTGRGVVTVIVMPLMAGALLMLIASLTLFSLLFQTTMLFMS